MSVKQCTQCRREGAGPKFVAEFCKGTGPDGLQSMCREHTRAYNRAWAKRNPEKNRAKGKRFRAKAAVAYRKISLRTNLRCKYGLTEDGYRALWIAQQGKCAICALSLIDQLDHTREFTKHPANEVARVDHCHETGKVRGLLCFGCNVGLGKFRDSEQLLLTAARYLRDSRNLATPQPQTPRQGVSEIFEPTSSRDLGASVSRGSRQQELYPFLN